jgi:hypothetical protein
MLKLVTDSAPVEHFDRGVLSGAADVVEVPVYGPQKSSQGWSSVHHVSETPGQVVAPSN